MNNMMFGKYLPIDSFIHRLDPRLKIGALLLLLIAVFFDAGFIGYALLGTFVIIMTLLSHIKVSQVLKAVKPMLFMMAQVQLCFREKQRQVSIQLTHYRLWLE